MFLAWGRDWTWIYNDAFVPILGRKHPHALGRPAMEVWKEARAALQPLFERVFAGESVHMQDIALMLDRRGVLEEAHFAFSYSPVRDGHGSVAGLFGVCIETTEHVLADRREQAAQLRQRRLFEQAPGFIAILAGPEHRYEFVNEAYVQLAGARDYLGRSVREVMPELHGQGFFELLDSVYRSGERYRADRERLLLEPHADGAPVERFVDFVYAPVLDEAGATIGIFVEGHDVTGAHRSRVALESSQRRQALLLELGDQLRTLDTERDMACAAARLLASALGMAAAGCAAVDPIGGTLAVQADACDGAAAPLRRATASETFLAGLRGGDPRAVADASRAGDDPLPALLQAAGAAATAYAPVVCNEVRGLLIWVADPAPRDWSTEDLGFLRAVAERTRWAVERLHAEHDLRALTATLERQVAERTADRDRVWRNSRDLLAVADTDGRVRAVNPALTAILGYTLAEVVGRMFLDFVWPDDVAASAGALAAVAGGRDLTAFEHRMRHRDGSPRWISWHTAGDGGRIYAYGRDITAQKQQAAALQQAEDALRQSQKLEAMGQLTGGVAHDFNNLLAVISNNLHLHRMLSADCAESPQLAAIARAADTGARLTRQLLAFARRQAIRPETIRPQRELEELEQVLQATLGSRIGVRLTLDPQAPAIRVDRSELQLALINLAMNARDAMVDGGTLAVQVRPAPPLQAGGPPTTAIDVTDSGHGIPAAIRDRVLEPFFTTKGPAKGTGLGLSQVYGFATQAGGRLEIDSQPGRTRITLLLPAADGPVADDEHDAPPAHGALTGGRVLLVEDNAEVGATTGELLRTAGCEVVQVANGGEAIERLLAGGTDFDLVLSDLVMPGEVSGVALAMWLREQRPLLPVLLTTGYSSELAAAREQGFTVLQKPVPPDDLLAAVARALPASGRAGRMLQATAGSA
jgi:PAS domain S-box-containing protein